ncbi:MAG: hypothetical protein HPY57_14420 [Ignavibacteria bacterium]|nr:hypothetical protein [Ignavibacteria bacterium]
MDEEYLKLFKHNQEDENLNETKQNQQWENLNKPKQNQWQKLNEIDKSAQQYNVNENANDGWGTLDFQIETRINGVPQQQQNHPFLHLKQNRKANDPNGLNQYINDDYDLREVVKQPNVQQVQQGPIEILIPPVVQDIKNIDVVSIEMFENMNSNAMLTLANKKINQIDLSKVTNQQEDRQVRFLDS